MVCARSPKVPQWDSTEEDQAQVNHLTVPSLLAVELCHGCVEDAWSFQGGGHPTPWTVTRCSLSGSWFSRWQVTASEVFLRQRCLVRTLGHGILQTSLKTTYVRDGGRRATVVVCRALSSLTQAPWTMPVLEAVASKPIPIMRSSRWASRTMFMTVSATCAPVPSGDTGTPSSSSVSSPVMRTAMRSSRDFPSAMLGNKFPSQWSTSGTLMSGVTCGGDDRCAVPRPRMMDGGPRER